MMKRNADDLRRLIAELQNDAEQLSQLHAINGRAAERIASGAEDYLDYAALGYTIHNIYSVMENACLRVAKFFENNLSDTSWHKELLERMRLTIEGVRPAFLDEQTYLLLDELWAFRHVSRNLYARTSESSISVSKSPPAVWRWSLPEQERLDSKEDMLHPKIAAHVLALTRN